MMIRSNRSRKFSMKYRIEKWFYEDSINCLIECFRGIGGMILFAAMIASILLLPALFH